MDLPVHAFERIRESMAMTRALLTLVVAVAISTCLAADPATVGDSARPLRGAVDATGANSISTHLPGHGLSITASYIGDFELEEVLRQLEGIVSGLAGLVRGLDDGDWVSVSWRGSAVFKDEVFIVVRMRPGDASSLETWVNGALQN